jgi:exopolyphosphatase/guanosine-5'-triphosphate,3'-diphosphate pyrophosphatase
MWPNPLPEGTKLLAGVDIGSNTVRLLFAKFSAGQLRPVRYFRRITRLAGDYDPQRGLASSSMARTLDALRQIRDLIDQAGVRRVRMVGTQALRQAVNGRRFAGRVKQCTGLSLEIISGGEEARLSCRGVLAALRPQPERCLVFDIGGGSTEFILSGKNTPYFHRSYPLGVVALCEQYSDSTGRQRGISDIMHRLTADFAAINPRAGQESAIGTLVGTAGTVTTLAALKLRMVHYDGARINNVCLRRAELMALRRKLTPLSSSERECLPGLERGRGDLILPGLEIVLAILDRFRQDDLKVSDYGLLEGLLIDMHHASEKSCSPRIV